MARRILRALLPGALILSLALNALMIGAVVRVWQLRGWRARADRPARPRDAPRARRSAATAPPRCRARATASARHAGGSAPCSPGTGASLPRSRRRWPMCAARPPRCRRPPMPRCSPTPRDAERGAPGSRSGGRGASDGKGVERSEASSASSTTLSVSSETAISVSRLRSLRLISTVHLADSVMKTSSEASRSLASSLSDLAGQRLERGQPRAGLFRPLADLLDTSAPWSRVTSDHPAPRPSP